MNMLFAAANTNVHATHALAQNPVIVIVILALALGLVLALIIYVIYEVFAFLHDLLNNWGK
jgi:hypothetical protein